MGWNCGMMIQPVEVSLTMNYGSLGLLAEVCWYPKLLHNVKRMITPAPYGDVRATGKEARDIFPALPVKISSVPICLADIWTACQRAGYLTGRQMSRNIMPQIF